MSRRAVILAQQQSVSLDLETGYHEDRALRLSKAGLSASDAISVHPVPATGGVKRSPVEFVGAA
jgi:hypothetical protein